MKKVKMAVIGAGASGMMAAITAAKNGGIVTLYEKNDRVGKKILATGNGRCNLGNLKIGLSQYNSEDLELAGKILENFTVYDILSFFESAGMLVKEKDGYLYPVSDQAATVLDTLRIELRTHQVTVCCDSRVTEIKEISQGFQIIAGKTKTVYDKVIISCGSKASLKMGEGEDGYRFARQLQHSLRPVVPALVQLRCQEGFLKALAGVRCQSQVTLLIDGEAAQIEKGELQFTNYGISGIPIFQLSRIAALALGRGQKVAAVIDFLPNYDRNVYSFFTKNRFQTSLNRNLEEYLLGMANKKINQVIIKNAGFQPTHKIADLGEAKVSKLMEQYKEFKLHITDTNSFENAQVCAGGVSLQEVSPHLESRFHPGLYFTGELLDVDGRCGGYNLQWAWASGYTAGRHAASSGSYD